MRQLFRKIEHNLTKSVSIGNFCRAVFIYRNQNPLLSAAAARPGPQSVQKAPRGSLPRGARPPARRFRSGTA